MELAYPGAMRMRRLTHSDYRKMPWRNGAGTTTELVAEPAGAERFLYRVSIADVERDGPFSRFEGYDRHIMLLEGGGMSLDCGEHGVVDLSAPLTPHSFSGDWDVRGTLTAGPVRDFNLIVDRARASATLNVHSMKENESLTLAANQVTIVYVLTGALVCAREGDTLIGDIVNIADAHNALVARLASRVAVASLTLR